CLSYHLNAKHPTESSPRLDGRQPTLHDFTRKITRPVREKVTNAVEYLLWLLIKHYTQYNVKMARALCPATSYHEQTVLPSHTCINSVPTQNNDMQLEQYGTLLGNIVDMY